MIQGELTERARAVTTMPMQSCEKQKRRAGRPFTGAAMLMGSVMALSACVSVSAPDKPIVIELNINIKHELIVELAQDAKKTIDEHGDIF